MNPMQAPKQASPEAFNPAIFAQTPQSQSFEAVNSQAMQSAPDLYAAPPVEMPIDLRTHLIVDSSKHENPAMARWMAERETAKQQRFAEMAAFVLSTQSLFEQSVRAEEEKKKEKVNA